MVPLIALNHYVNEVDSPGPQSLYAYDRNTMMRMRASKVKTGVKVPKKQKPTKQHKSLKLYQSR